MIHKFCKQMSDLSITDEEKLRLAAGGGGQNFSLESRPFLAALFQFLDHSDNDYIQGRSKKRIIFVWLKKKSSKLVPSLLHFDCKSVFFLSILNILIIYFYFPFSCLRSVSSTLCRSTLESIRHKGSIRHLLCFIRKYYQGNFFVFNDIPFHYSWK